METSGKISHITTPQSSVPPVKTQNAGAVGDGKGEGEGVAPAGGSTAGARHSFKYSII